MPEASVKKASASRATWLPCVRTRGQLENPLQRLSSPQLSGLVSSGPGLGLQLH